MEEADYSRYRFICNGICRLGKYLWVVAKEILEVSPFQCSLKQTIVTKVLFAIFCFSAALGSANELWVESCQWWINVKGTSNVAGYVIFLKDFMEIFLRFVFLHFYYRLLHGFATRMNGKYPEGYNDIFTKKKWYCWISVLSIFVVIALIPIGYYTGYVFPNSFVWTLVQSLGMILEQYALDTILVVAITLNSAIKKFFKQVKGIHNRIESEEDDCLSRQISGASDEVSDGIHSHQNKGSPLRIKVESVEEELKRLKYTYKELGIIFKLTNDLIWIMFPIMLLVALLKVSSLEDIFLNEKVKLVNKIEYGFVFCKIALIVILGCLISKTRETLMSDEYSSVSGPTHIPNGKNNKFNRQGLKVKRQGKRRQTLKNIHANKRRRDAEKAATQVSTKMWSDSQAEPIRLGNYPFSMDIKFLFHNLGLAVFAIFYNIVSSREKETNICVTNNVNNSLLINGTRYECLLTANI